MLYLFYLQGDYERREVTAVFEVPEGVDASYQAFLREATLSAAGIKDPELAHLQWLEQHPQVRSVPFEEL